MRLTVLGKSPAWPDAGGACSGYLIEEAGTALLLDCGSGVFGKLRSHLDYAEVDAVVISHLHADHVLDLVPFASALAFGPRAGTVARPSLHAPPGAGERFAALCAGGGMPADHVAAAFALEEYDVADALTVGPLAVSFASVPHFAPTQAVQVGQAGGGRRLTFGADSGPSDALVDFAAGTDLLLIEATLAEPEPEGPRGHLTAAEAGEHGRRAGAGRLVLTHRSDELDAEQARADAERTFGGPVELAAEGAVYEL